MKFTSLLKPFRHPATQKARLVVRRTVIVCSVILAVAVVTSIAVDVGPALKGLAEREGSRYLGRPMTIGRLEMRLWDGSYIVENLRIDSLPPTSTPFLDAKRITVVNSWRTLFNRRFVLERIEMTDWRMHVETTANGTTSFPDFRRGGPRGQSRWTTTLAHVRAHRGEFTFQDFGSNWGIVARNIDVVVEKPTPDAQYRGTAKFTDGLTAIQNYVPFRTDMDSSFQLDGGRLMFERMSLITEGTRSELIGDVNFNYWPELMLAMKSTIDFPKARELFFAGDNFSLTGKGAFTGTFHMFKELMPNGQQRTGRELKGQFRTDVLGVNQYRFNDVRGDLRWTPELFAVTDGTGSLYGGTTRFGYRMAPLNAKGVTPTATFTTEYDEVELAALSDLWQFDGIRLAGRASGTNRLEWPLRRYRDHTGGGSVRVTPSDETMLMTRDMPLARIAARAARGHDVGPFSPLTPVDPVAIGGEIVYEFGPDWVDIEPSRIATESTLVDMQGRTNYGEESDLLFHVSSADWQESDRVFAGVLTAFGARTRAIPIGGYGTFDGEMTGTFRSPRIEGEFSGEQIRAWDVVWGAVRGHARIQNSYVDVTGVTITSGPSVITTTGRYSLGFPRKDEGEEINARIEIADRPVADLRHAFGIDDYDIEGLLTGDFSLTGKYLTPDGSGRMAIASAVLYGEPMDSATSTVRLEGKGARLQDIEIRKGGGRGTGNAYIGWDGTYSFNFDANGIPAESIRVSKNIGQPISALLDFSAVGSGSFEAPRYEVKGRLLDVFVADEGIGQVGGRINVNNGLMTIQLDAASPRLSVRVTGQVALPDNDAEITVTVIDTSLDPYVRLFLPQLSPYTTAVVSGSMRVVGQLNDIDNLLVDATVDQLDMRLFDYALRNANARPIRLALDHHKVRVADMRIVGQDTQIDIAGVADLHDETINMRANGDANLAVLQGFVSDLRSSGTATLSATLEGPLYDPVAGGTLAIKNGRVRHFALPHGFERIDGAVRFDSRGITLDGLTGELGGGAVTFGGRVDKEGYRVGRLNVTMSGRDMRLRFPEGMRSLVDADLTLQGSAESAVLAGLVTVKNAVYREAFTTTGSLFDFSQEPSLAPAAPAAETLPVRLEIQVNAPSTLQVDNRTLRLDASADLQLRGTIGNPVLLGRADIDRGEALFEGKRYIITRGTVDFNNPTRIEPFLDIEAETRIRVPQETYQVTLRVTGPLAQPNFSFNSDPPLGEFEILALVFSDVSPGGNAELRQFDQLTPQQRLFRERAARALTDVLSTEVSRVVEETFGVDTFQITPSLQDPNAASSAALDPGMRVTVLKRLSERLYLTYSRSLSSSGGRDTQLILLEFDQTNRLSWILSRNEDGTYALDWRVRKVF